MEVSLFLAKVVGLYMVVVGFALIFRKELFLAAVDDLLTNPALMVFSTVLSLIIGLLMVVSHNVWVIGWPVLITILGYMSLMKGIIRFFIVGADRKMAYWFMTGRRLEVVGVINLLIGTYLSSIGFQVI